MLEHAAESQSDAPSTTRLVIRVKLIPQQPPPPPAWYQNRNALLLIVGVVAALLVWLGISIFKSDSPPPPVAAPSPKPAPVTTSVQSVPTPAEPEVRQSPDAPTSVIKEVIPDVPRSALDTIRGTVRVSVQVGIDKQGTVIDATVTEPGPSRYFRRLALESAKQWTFSPVNLEERRTMLVRFNFTRSGVTAETSPAE